VLILSALLAWLTCRWRSGIRDGRPAFADVHALTARRRRAKPLTGHAAQRGNPLAQGERAAAVLDAHVEPPREKE